MLIDEISSILAHFICLQFMEKYFKAIKPLSKWLYLFRHTHTLKIRHNDQYSNRNSSIWWIVTYKNWLTYWGLCVYWYALCSIYLPINPDSIQLVYTIEFISIGHHCNLNMYVMAIIVTKVSKEKPGKQYGCFRLLFERYRASRLL